MVSNTPPHLSWGLHLWDKSEEVFGHTSLDIATLTSCYAKFYKELGEIERDYARGVRKLCNKFAPKQDVGCSIGRESDRDKCFKLFLKEFGYKAGQHEILSELYSKSIPEDLKIKVKEANKEIERLRKELKRSQEVTEHVQKSHEKYNIKHQKCYQEAIFAERSWHKAESDTSMSRREVEKLRAVAVEKQKQCDESKKVLERHSIKLEDVSNNHLHRSLPSILDNLQSLSIETGNSLVSTMERGVTAELEAERVVSSCSREMSNIVSQVMYRVKGEHIFAGDVGLRVCIFYPIL